MENKIKKYSFLKGGAKGVIVTLIVSFGAFIPILIGAFPELMNKPIYEIITSLFDLIVNKYFPIIKELSLGGLLYIVYNWAKVNKEIKRQQANG